MKSQGRPAVAVAEFDEDGIEVSNPTASLVAHSGGLQRQQTDYSTVLRVTRPRQRKELTKACLEEAGLAGEDFFYAWTVKGKDGKKELIEGTSIDGAMIMVRNWGNCVTPISEESEGPQHWVLKAAFIDGETGYVNERLFRQRKSQRTGKMDADRALDIAYQIGQSKAQRNVIVKSLPTWLVKQCLEAAKESAAGKYQDVPKKTPGFIKRFGELGVTQEQLEKKLGRTVDKWEPRDLMTLAAIGRAIADRQTTAEEEFSEDEPSNPEATAPAAGDGAAATPKDEAKADAGAPESGQQPATETTK